VYDHFSQVAMAPFHQHIVSSMEKIRGDRPLIHSITNFVTMNITANALLAIGASPVMAHAIEEVEEMTALSRALVINTGTSDPERVKSMKRAMQKASRCGKPIALDPVGAGATPYRRRVVRELMEAARPTVLCGNASEIRALVDKGAQTRGVDSTVSPLEVLEAARTLSQDLGCVIVVSGKTDLVVAGNTNAQVRNGCAMMGKVSGLGCTATALTAAFMAVEQSAFEAALQAMAVMGVAGEVAAEQARGPGSFHYHFLDALYQLDLEQLKQRLNITKS